MPVTLWPMRQTREHLGEWLAIWFGVPPLGSAAAGPPEGGTPNPIPRFSMGFSKHVLRLSILALIINCMHVCAQDAGFGPAISVPHDLPEARLGSLPARNRIDQT